MSEIHIDGSQGEGGGQVLRTSLALSAITGTPVHVTRVRAKRSKPGLLRQHLTALRAAAEVAGARVTGDELGSGELRFVPLQLGASDLDGRMQVRAGLAAGDEIVVYSEGALRAGRRIEVVATLDGGAK